MITSLDWARQKAWAMHPPIMRTMLGILHRHANGNRLTPDAIAEAVRTRHSARVAGVEDSGNDVPPVPYVCTPDGVAVISVQGVIAKRASLIEDVSTGQASSCERILSNVNLAKSDKRVRAIVLDVDSPGGTVDGVAGLSDELYSLRGKIPLVAFANGLMCSAAYWIGSACDRIVATQDAEVGSIGVYSILSDYSEMLKTAGVSEELIRAGKFKGEGHPDFPITQAAKDLAQTSVDDYYSIFVSAVARNRGLSQSQAAMLADGTTTIGRKCLANGLADSIGVLFDACKVALSPGVPKQPNSARNISRHPAAPKAAIWR